MMAPPAVGLDFSAGDRTCATIGELYIKSRLCVEAKPATVTTIADAAPVPLGATHLKDVWSTITVTDVQSLPPTLTETRLAVALVPKFVPVTVMTKPPDVGLLPEVWRKVLTTGAS
jgi:hypothetical protein